MEIIVSFMVGASIFTLVGHAIGYARAERLYISKLKSLRYEITSKKWDNW